MSILDAADAARDSQLSAMFDGELPSSECELLARRLTRDEQLRGQWSRYALIGAVVRREPLRVRRGVSGGVVGSAVASRVAAALAAEPLIQESLPAVAFGAAAPPRVNRWWKPAAGFGIAASVAVLSVVWLQGRQPVQPPVVVAASAVAALGTTAAVAPDAIEIIVAPPSVSRPGSGEPFSYVVPPASRRSAAAPSAQLANYVVAHSEVSAPLTRRNVLSALVSEDEPLALPGSGETAVDRDARP